ncbi:hypothetical protein HPB49_018816 [Dermacentor silvarum]|uniref:Uncharacterized protein n=1 Tax=Dermacentor silvarum TaxID=543639 RepID=A0ACB8CGZ0_DERSI|nr:hypothetical protein HPB49_018816 [Dermacentor silvarum]
MDSVLGTSLLKFSVDIYKQLYLGSECHGNIFYSPFSIAAALSMTLAGARNRTAQQLRDALHVTNEQSHHRHFSSFLRDKISGYAPDVKLHVANRIYRERSFGRLPHFDWVELVTSSKIKDLLPPGIVDSWTLLVLVNAVHFKGLWKDQFDSLCTQRHDFYLDSSNKKAVEMMVQNNDYRMARSDELKLTALEVPYKCLNTSLVILLPQDVDGIDFLSNNCIGVKDLFSTDCDLSGICENSKVSVTKVIHKAYMEINEEGTEAAAATAEIVLECLLISRKIRFVVDHPFLFLIMCNDPELVLFMGSVREL